MPEVSTKYVHHANQEDYRKHLTLLHQFKGTREHIYKGVLGVLGDSGLQDLSTNRLVPGPKDRKQSQCLHSRKAKCQKCHSLLSSSHKFYFTTLPVNKMMSCQVKIRFGEYENLM